MLQRGSNRVDSMLLKTWLPTHSESLSQGHAPCDEDDMKSPSSSITAVHTFKTDLGWIGFRATPSGVTDLTFGHLHQNDAIERLNLNVRDSNISSRLNSGSPTLRWESTAEELLTRYAAGEVVDLSGIPRVLFERTPFERQVHAALSQIGYGETISYGELAEQAGSPRAARAVGTIMSRNRIPLIIPCHRVLAAGGKIGGYSASAGIATKQHLLQLEQTGMQTVSGQSQMR